MDPRIFLLVLALCAAGRASTEPSECREVVCPQLAHIECPDDSYPSLLAPPHYVAAPADAARVLAKRSLVQQYHKRESIKIVPGYMRRRRRSVPDLEDQPPTAEYNNTDALYRLCCPRKECLCRIQCSEPTCVGDLVPLVKRQGSRQPGNCCPTYRCDRPPNCALLESGYEWREYCKHCHCEAGVSVCREEEECRVGATAASANRVTGCLSRRLGKHFPTGAVWMEDECIHCRCSADGEPNCQVSVCKTLTCEKQIKPPGECCPRCDLSDTHFCEGHEFCSIVCKNGYQRHNTTNCNLCRCAAQAAESSSNFSPTPSATAATPEGTTGGLNNWIWILLACICALLAIILVVLACFCCHRGKKSYETVSTVDSRQSSEVSSSKSNGGVVIERFHKRDILGLEYDLDGDTMKKTLRDQNGTLTNQHNYS